MRGSSPPSAASTGRRCRSARSPPRASSRASRPSARNGIEVHHHQIDRLDAVLLHRRRRARADRAGRAGRRGPSGAASSPGRRASRGSRCSRSPASTGSPASASSFAVPPVDSISTPSACSPRASSTSPRLSETLSSARFALGIDVLRKLLHVHARHPLADRGQHLVGDRVAPPRDVVGRGRPVDGRTEHRHARRRRRRPGRR